MGCVVELLHTATLIHDDVVDQAPLRRGRPSANARWGTTPRSWSAITLLEVLRPDVEDGDPACSRRSPRDRVHDRGRGVQLERKRSGTPARPTTSGHHPEDRVVHVRLLSHRCAPGRASPEQVEGLTRYGLDIGIAFQISDDSLDFVADQARLGKAVGADLKEGKRTLPLIATIERAGRPTGSDPHPAQATRAHPRGDRGDPAARGQARGVEYALERAHEYAQSAKAALGPFPGSADKDTLLLVADFVVDRDR